MSQPTYPYLITVATPGPKGPQGEQGPSGSQGPQGEPGVTTPGGNNTEIQFNNGGAFGGNPKFTYDLSNDTVTLTGSFTITSSNTFTNIGPAVFSGSLSASSIYVSESLIVNNAPVLTSADGTASYAVTASYALNSQVLNTASFATTGSNTFSGDQTIQGQINLDGGTIAYNLFGGGGIDIVAADGQYAELASSNTQSLIWVDDGGAYIGTDWDNVARQWTFGSDGKLTTPGAIEASAFTGSLNGTADYALTASHIDLTAGNGITISGNTITSKLSTVNGIAPTNGNASINLAYTITGASSSLVASSSGVITSSISDGSIWVISGDPTPANNGDSYIFVSQSSLAVPPGSGQWLPIAPLDTVAGDARYLMLNPQSPLAGTLNLGGNNIVSGSLIGTASWASNVSNALTASYVLNAVSASVATSAASVRTAGVFGAVQYRINSGTLGGVPTLTYIGGILRATGSFTGSLVGSLTGTSSWATSASQAVSASYTLSSSYALSSSFALSSSYALSSSFALSSSYSLSSSYALSSSFAESSSYSLSSSYALSSSYSISSSYTLSSSYALSASYTLSSSQATSASIAQTASFIPTGTYQVTASWAISSSQAISSSVAQTASFLPLNTYQITASRAVSASNATTASYALAVAGGGAGSPGGSNTQIQYNNNGAFGGIPTLIYNGTTLTATGSFSGSLIGTASYADTSSRAITASYALTSAGTITNAVSASIAQTSSFLLNSISNDISSYGATGTGTAVYVKDAINPLTGLPYGTGGQAAADTRWNLVKNKWSIDEVNFSTLTNYPVGGQILINNGIQNVTTTFTAPSTWVATTSYNVGNNVTYNGIRYKAKYYVKGNALNQGPSLDTTNWEVWTSINAAKEIASDFNNAVTGTNSLLLGAVATGSKVIIYSKSTTSVTATGSAGVSPANFTTTRTKTYNTSNINLTTDTVDWVALQQALYEEENTSGINKRVLDLGYGAEYVLSKPLDLPLRVGGASNMSQYTINGNNSTLSSINNTKMKLVYRDVPYHDYAVYLGSFIDKIIIRDLRFKLPYNSVRDTNPSTQSTGLMLAGYQCTVENCEFAGGDIGLDLQFALQSFVKGCKFIEQNVFGLAVRNGQWFEATTSDDQSNGTIVDGCRWRLKDQELISDPPAQFAAAYIAGASDCSVRNIIFEGGLNWEDPAIDRTNYGLIFDTVGATNAKDFEVYNVHLEKRFAYSAFQFRSPADSNIYVGKCTLIVDTRIIDHGPGPIIMNADTKFNEVGTSFYTAGSANGPRVILERFPYKPSNPVGTTTKPFLNPSQYAFWRVTDVMVNVPNQPKNSTEWIASGSSIYETTMFTQPFYDGFINSPTYNTIQTTYVTGSNLTSTSKCIVSNFG